VPCGWRFQRASYWVFGQSSSGSQFIQWDRQTFSVSGRDIVLIGGSMHHFRIPSEEWETDFQRMQEDGFNLVNVYIPWFFHEPEEGKVNFESLQKFLNLARKYGIYVVARPGPYINDESDQGAFPRRLSGKNVGFRRNTELYRKWAKHSSISRTPRSVILAMKRWEHEMPMQWPLLSGLVRPGVRAL
jgi:Glycosyl hydrolases family 35